MLVLQVAPRARRLAQLGDVHEGRVDEPLAVCSRGHGAAREFHGEQQSAFDGQRELQPLLGAGVEAVAEVGDQPARVEGIQKPGEKRAREPLARAAQPGGGREIGGVDTGVALERHAADRQVVVELGVAAQRRGQLVAQILERAGLRLHLTPPRVRLRHDNGRAFQARSPAGGRRDASLAGPAAAARSAGPNTPAAAETGDDVGSSIGAGRSRRGTSRT